MPRSMVSGMRPNAFRLTSAARSDSGFKCWCMDSSSFFFSPDSSRLPAGMGARAWSPRYFSAAASRVCMCCALAADSGATPSGSAAGFGAAARPAPARRRKTRDGRAGRKDLQYIRDIIVGHPAPT